MATAKMWWVETTSSHSNNDARPEWNSIHGQNPFRVRLKGKVFGPSPAGTLFDLWTGYATFRQLWLFSLDPSRMPDVGCDYRSPFEKTAGFYISGQITARSDKPSMTGFGNTPVARCSLELTNRFYAGTNQIAWNTQHHVLAEAKGVGEVDVSTPEQYFQLPPLTFDLDRTHPLRAEVEATLKIKVSGGCSVEFGKLTSFDEDEVAFRVPQWSIASLDDFCAAQP